MSTLSSNGKAMLTPVMVTIFMTALDPCSTNYVDY